MCLPDKKANQTTPIKDRAVAVYLCSPAAVLTALNPPLARRSEPEVRLPAGGDLAPPRSVRLLASDPVLGTPAALSSHGEIVKDLCETKLPF
jgi:hypothetical protein